MADRPPRVLVVLSSSNRRGAEIQAMGLTAALGAAGFEVSAVALQPHGSGDPLDVEVLGARARSFAVLRRLRAETRRVDVVIGYGSSTLPLCTAATLGLDCRFVYRSIGDPAAWSRGGLHRARTGLLFRRADRVATLFDDASRSVERLYRVSPTRLGVIPNARDADAHPVIGDEDRARHRRELGLAPDRPVIAVVGSLSAEKRVPLAIEAVEHLDGSLLLVAGDGPLRSEVEVRAVASRADVRLLGNLSDLRPVYGAADVVLSTSRTEGMPGVLIEAALCGVPAVATDVGASAEVVGPGGVVVPASSSAGELAAAIRAVLAGRVEFASRAATHSRATFTWEHVVPKWADLIEGLGADGRHPPPRVSDCES